MMTDIQLPRPADPFQHDGQGNRIDWRHLVRKAPLEEVSNYLCSFDSYARARAMALVMVGSNAQRCVQIFLDWDNMSMLVALPLIPCRRPEADGVVALVGARRLKLTISPVELIRAAQRA